MQKKALDEMLDPQSRQSMSLGCSCLCLRVEWLGIVKGVEQLGQIRS